MVNLVVREPYDNLTGKKFHVPKDVIIEFSAYKHSKTHPSEHSISMKLNLLQHEFEKRGAGGLIFTVQRKGNVLLVQGQYSEIKEISNFVTSRHNMDDIGVKKIA